jgi:hypothetical protein
VHAALRRVLSVLTIVTTAVVVAPAVPAAAAPGSPELSTSTRLADRRATVIGDRAYEVMDASGRYPALGFHTRGEMGGIWSPPVKLLDGVWFSVDGAWLGGADAPASAFTSSYGSTRIDYRAGGVEVARTDVVPDGKRGLLVGLTLTPRGPARSVQLALDAHSELMGAYPWGETTPSQTAFNLPDTGAVDGNALVFRETGTPPVPNATPHDWAAAVGSSAVPTGSTLGPDHRGPQDPAVVCGPSGPNTPPAPARCDDTAYGKGTGGQLRYTVALTPGRPTSVWFAVGGSETGPAEATATMKALLADPAGLLAAKQRARADIAARTQVSLPGDKLLAQSVEWYKQNLADSVQESRDMELRVTSEGKQYPAPAGTLASARWYGAGWPDYPWLFGTDGEYTAFAAVAAGQFETITEHLRALRDVSEIVNQRSGKVMHEMMQTGDVYFGTLDSAGNTDETAKFPSAVATLWRWTGDNALRDEFYDFSVRNMRYVVDVLDTDQDGWPEGLGNVERNGMGPEKLDNAVYTIRGLRDLQDMALAKSDAATATWAGDRAAALEQRFEAEWWFGGDTDSYADSREGGTAGQKIYQRHWIGLTPTDAVIVRPGQPARPLASDEHGNATLTEREQACYSFPLGMWHTGTGPTSAPGGNPGPSCDTVVSSVPSERSAFSLTTSIRSVSEANFGRMGRDQLQHDTTALARIQLDPSVWEMPGASPEIAPGGSFGANIDLKFTERSSVLQAWGAYGVIWPVVHSELGVDPDLGRNTVSVVPQVPDGQTQVGGTNIRLGSGSVDVQASRTGRVLRTVVTPRLTAALTIGALLPAGATARTVTLDGRPVAAETVKTARGTEVRVATDGQRTHTLVVQT